MKEFLFGLLVWVLQSVIAAFAGLSLTVAWDGARAGDSLGFAVGFFVAAIAIAIFVTILCVAGKDLLAEHRMQEAELQAKANDALFPPIGSGRKPLTIEGIERVTHAYAGTRRLRPEVAGIGSFWAEFVRTHDALRDAVRLLLDAVPMVVECYQTWPPSSRPQPEDWLRRAGRLGCQSDAPASESVTTESLWLRVTTNLAAEYRRIVNRLAGGRVMGVALDVNLAGDLPLPPVETMTLVVAAYHAGYADSTKAERKSREERGL